MGATLTSQALPWMRQPQWFGNPNWGKCNVYSPKAWASGSERGCPTVRGQSNKLGFTGQLLCAQVCARHPREQEASRVIVATVEDSNPRRAVRRVPASTAKPRGRRVRQAREAPPRWRD